MDFTCPLPDTLTAINLSLCPFKFGQMVRLGFQRRQSSLTPPFASVAEIQGAAKWGTLLSANDNTKIVLSPIFAGMVIPPSEAQTVGGNDNSTFNGIPEYNGEGFVLVTGVFKDIPPQTKRDLDKLTQESVASAVGLSNLTAYFFSASRKIYANNPQGVGGIPTTKHFGVPIFNFRLSSVGSEGFNAHNVHNFSFYMPSDWANYLTVIEPTFDPLSDLVSTVHFDNLVSFDTATKTVAGVNLTAKAANAAVTFEFNNKTNLSGQPLSMTLKLGAVTQLVVDATTDWVGSPWRFKADNGIFYNGSFVDGVVNIS